MPFASYFFIDSGGTRRGAYFLREDRNDLQLTIFVRMSWLLGAPDQPYTGTYHSVPGGLISNR